MGQYQFEVPFPSKPIPSLITWPDDPGAINPQNLPIPRLIFTHGSRGSLTSEAMANFSSGFATQLPILTFQGNVKLIGRTKMFNAIVEDLKLSPSLGGRSLGARAAVMAASGLTSHLVLVSYPLHAGNAVRDQILLDIAPETKVIFVSGDRDRLCNLERLEEVRAKMKCLTWRIVVRDANHDMKIKPKASTKDVIKKSGEVVAAWMNASDDGQREGVIFLNSEGLAEWTEWSSESTLNKHYATPAVKPGKKRTVAPSPTKAEKSSKRPKA